MRGHGRARAVGVVAGLAGAAALVVLGVATPSGASRSGAPRALTPIVECSVTRHGSTRTLFGYRNTGPAVTLSVGQGNAFSPGPADRGQPTSFQSGTQINVFAVDAPERLTWTLGGASVHTPGQSCQTTPASSAVAGWGPIVAVAVVTAVLGALLFWRTRRLRMARP